VVEPAEIEVEFQLEAQLKVKSISLRFESLGAQRQTERLTLIYL